MKYQFITNIIKGLYKNLYENNVCGKFKTIKKDKDYILYIYIRIFKLNATINEKQ